MVALATQKFISDVARDALQCCKHRQNTPQGNKAGKGKVKQPRSPFFSSALILPVHQLILTVSLAGEAFRSHSTRSSGGLPHLAFRIPYCVAYLLKSILITAGISERARSQRCSTSLLCLIMINSLLFDGC